MKTKTKETISVRLQPISLQTVKVKIVGKTPLLMDRMPDSVKESILLKQTGIVNSSKKKRDVNSETKEAIHITSKGKIGFPASAFKNAMINSASFVGTKDFSKKLICGAIRITNSDEGLILINYKKQGVLKHSIGHNTKFSPVFEGWSCDLDIQYDANNISHADIITLLNYAGFYVGVGAWRPKSRDGGSGEFGTFECK